jgi:hypothetical protein
MLSVVGPKLRCRTVQRMSADGQSGHSDCARETSEHDPQRDSAKLFVSRTVTCGYREIISLHRDWLAVMGVPGKCSNSEMLNRHPDGLDMSTGSSGPARPTPSCEIQGAKMQRTIGPNPKSLL